MVSKMDLQIITWPTWTPERWTGDFRADGREECRNYFVHANSVPNASSVVFRKTIYDRVGGADEHLRACGDWKLWVLMAFEGRVAYLSEPLNYYREHEGPSEVIFARRDWAQGNILQWCVGCWSE